MITSDFLIIAKNQFISTANKKFHNSNWLNGYLNGCSNLIDVILLTMKKIDITEDLNLQKKIDDAWKKFDSKTINESQFKTALKEFINNN